MVCCVTSRRVSIHHEQKDGSEFSNVSFASDDDNDNSDLIEYDQEVDKTHIEDYGQDVLKQTQGYLHSNNCCEKFI